MFARRAVCLAAVACTAAALDVRIKGGLPIPLGKIGAATALDVKASWGGAQGNLAHLPTWLDSDDIMYIEVPELVPGTALELAADEALDVTPLGAVDPPTTCTTTFFIAAYDCGAAEPCAASVHGGLPARLEAAGFAKYASAPRFTQLSMRGYEHPTALYARTLAAGERLVTPGPDTTAQYIAVFAAGCGVQVVPDEHPAPEAKAPAHCHMFCPTAHDDMVLGKR